MMFIVLFRFCLSAVLSSYILTISAAWLRLSGSEKP
jgi:hypothetical protein